MMDFVHLPMKFAHFDTNRMETFPRRKHSEQKVARKWIFLNTQHNKINSRISFESNTHAYGLHPRNLKI